MPDRIKLNECSVNRTTDNSDNNNADFEINNHQNGVSNAEMENGSVNSNNNNNNNNESDFETEEFSKLRCSSESNEELSERQRRRAARASNGYPGLDFASSIFSSGTIMKFRVISNELHNIQNVQLKRAEGEVAALQRRIEILGENLQKSEFDLKNAIQELDGVTQEFDKDEGNSIEIQQQLIEKYFSLIPEMNHLITNCENGQNQT